MPTISFRGGDADVLLGASAAADDGGVAAATAADPKPVRSALRLTMAISQSRRQMRPNAYSTSFVKGFGLGKRERRGRSSVLRMFGPPSARQSMLVLTWSFIRGSGTKHRQQRATFGDLIKFTAPLPVMKRIGGGLSQISRHVSVQTFEKQPRAATPNPGRSPSSLKYRSHLPISIPEESVGAHGHPHC